MRILAKARKRLLAVLHRFSICVVKETLSSIIIPSSLTSLLDFTLLFSIMNVILLLSMFDPRNIIWNLPRFTTTLLILNQLRSKCVSLENFRIPYLKFGEHEYILASPAWFYFLNKNIKSFIKSLNNIGSRIESSGTPVKTIRNLDEDCILMLKR